MDLDLRGRSAIVGASDDLALAAATALMSEGAHVVVCGHDAEELNRTSARLGSSATTILADISTEDGAIKFVREAVRRLGHVDILVTDTRMLYPRVAGHMGPVSYRSVNDLGLPAIIAMCHEAVPLMRKRAWGRVVGITYSADRGPIPDEVQPNMLNPATITFLQTLALELADTGVTVNTIQTDPDGRQGRAQPYQETTEATSEAREAGRLCFTSDFGKVVAFLCSEPARCISGTTWPVNVGLR